MVCICGNCKNVRRDARLYVFLSEDEEGVMVGQSQAVSTEALMNVFHPHDAENLDPKMVQITLLQYCCNVCLVKMVHVIKTCAIHYRSKIGCQ